MMFLLYLFSVCITGGAMPAPLQEKTEKEIVYELFRLRNEHKADSIEQYYADTVKLYMKYLKNVPRKTITQSDKNFWKAHPKNKFEITEPLQFTDAAGITTVTVFGKEYLDGISFQHEKIEIKFNRDKKIFSFRGFKWK